MANSSFHIDPSKNQIAEKSKGGWMSIRQVDGYLRFVLFLAVVGFAYIWNSHFAERQVSQRDKLKAEVKSLKAEYFMRKADLSASVRYTNIIANLDTIGLHKPEKAPFKLIKKKDK